MRFDLPQLLFALLLLSFPRPWMRWGKTIFTGRRRRSEGLIRRHEEPWHQSEPGDPAVSFRTEFGKIRNYLDLLRGSAGSLAVLGGMGMESCISVDPGASAAFKVGQLGLKIVLLLAGVLLQTVRYERGRPLFFPPIFFVAGVTVGLCGVKAAAFAFVLIWAVNPILKNPSVFLSVYAVLAALFGLLFSGFERFHWLVALCLIFLPVLLSALAQRPLVMLTRKSTGGARS